MVKLSKYLKICGQAKDKFYLINKLNLRAIKFYILFSYHQNLLAHQYNILRYQGLDELSYCTLILKDIYWVLL